MTAYLISYDLNNAGKNYEGVIQTIKDCSNGVWCSPLKSVWLIQSKLSANLISEQIRSVADSDDSIFVIEVTKNRYGWLEKGMWDYINKHF